MPDVNGQAHVKGGKSRFELLDARGVIDIHEAFNLLFMDSHPARQFRLRKPEAFSARYNSTLASSITEGREIMWRFPLPAAPGTGMSRPLCVRRVLQRLRLILATGMTGKGKIPEN